MSYLPVLWADGNHFCLRLTGRTTWHINGLSSLNTKGWYFLVANHRSWADILVLYYVFNRKAPQLKFFLKQQLIWIPAIGLACKVLHFPFLQRYSKTYLKKHPEKKGKDIETTRKSCEAFKLHPSTIILFPEGTRFTPEKYNNQQSPYPYLLRPKGTLLAFTLSMLGDCMSGVLDVSIAYDHKDKSLWDLFCGRVDAIYVNVDILPVPEDSSQ